VCGSSFFIKSDRDAQLSFADFDDMESTGAERRKYAKHRRSRALDGPWRRGLLRLGEFMARSGFEVQVVCDPKDATGAYVAVVPDIVIQVAWDSANGEELQEPATYSATIETPDSVRHLGYTRSTDELLGLLSAAGAMLPADDGKKGHNL